MTQNLYLAGLSNETQQLSAGRFYSAESRNEAMWSALQFAQSKYVLVLEAGDLLDRDFLPNLRDLVAEQKVDGIVLGQETDQRAPLSFQPQLNRYVFKTTILKEVVQDARGAQDDALEWRSAQLKQIQEEGAMVLRCLAKVHSFLALNVAETVRFARDLKDVLPSGSVAVAEEILDMRRLWMEMCSKFISFARTTQIENQITQAIIGMLYSVSHSLPDIYPAQERAEFCRIASQVAGLAEQFYLSTCRTVYGRLKQENDGGTPQLSEAQVCMVVFVDDDIEFTMAIDSLVKENQEANIVIALTTNEVSPLTGEAIEGYQKSAGFQIQVVAREKNEKIGDFYGRLLQASAPAVKLLFVELNYQFGYSDVAVRLAAVQNLPLFLQARHCVHASKRCASKDGLISGVVMSSDQLESIASGTMWVAGRCNADVFYTHARGILGKGGALELNRNQFEITAWLANGGSVERGLKKTQQREMAAAKMMMRFGAIQSWEEHTRKKYEAYLALALNTEQCQKMKQELERKGNFVQHNC